MSVRNNIFIIASTLLFLLVAKLSFPQPFQRELNLIPVSDTDGLLNNIYTGGHNNLEHQFIDIDADGDLDIFYLDSDQTFGWFENTGTKFNADFNYSLTNPENLFFSNWFYFVDIDADGDLDFFTSNNDQISYYKNEGNSTSPFFVIAQDTVHDDEGEPIYSEFSSNPIFVDIDGDNDYDFISGNSAGTLTYYENTGTPQNFNLKFITNVWQNIIIIGGSPEDPRHGASSIDFVDIDDDNDLDLFWGDFFSKSLYVIENQGTPTVPDMKRISDIYPINSDSVNTSGFNMPRFADIDGDDDYDLFVSVLYDATVPQSLIYYENTGNAQTANEIFITDDYLKTLDVGNNSSPVFADIDDDGDLDLFIGSFKNPTGSISFLENTGAGANPSFYFEDSIFFNITSELSVSPTIGDIDDDGDYDLLIGRFNGTLSLYINSGTASSPLFINGDTLKNNFGDVIDVGSSAVPLLIDIDNDSDLDLVIGGFNGKFYLYENTGTTTSYQFSLNSTYFTGLDVGDNSTPFLFDFNKDGTFDLFTGSRKGEFFYFRNDGSNSIPIWILVTNHFLPDNFGGYTFLNFVDIDNDTDYDLFLGNVKGGLYLYTNSEISTVADWEMMIPEEYYLGAFPNPFNPSTTIRIETKEAKKITIEIFNLVGEKVKTLHNDILPPGVIDFNWYGDSDSGNILPSGIYFVLASTISNSKAIKILFLK